MSRSETQPPAPSTAKPGPRAAGRPPTGGEAPSEAPSGTSEGRLFHALVEAGFDASVAYTVDSQVREMSDGVAAARVEALVAEMRLMRETLATKADLERCATKEDLERYATKEELATGLSALETCLMRWTFTALMAQLVLFFALFRWFA